ncbi:MAG TPA: hypothetical protein P5561_05295 [Candidatus Omnitrophota bacterium]|nr:hypothetical protein [Candidatus Omnitrophota bacterium]HRY85925.1 hypothetical protein [Candidatus Omnitrophota bacterium]
MKRTVANICVLVFMVAIAFALSGCASCCGEAAPAKAPATKGMLHGTIGCDDCELSSSPLRVDKEMPGQVVVGKPYTYTIKVTNEASCVLEDVVVIERVSEGYKIESANPSATKVSGRVAEWDIGYLKPNETKVITITGVASSPSATTSCTKADYNPVLCLGPGVGIPAILLEVVDTEDPVQVGGMEKFYVMVTNQGNAVDSDIVVKVDFEENFDYVSSGGPTAGKAESAKTVTFAPLAALAPGQKATWEVTAKAVSEGDHRTSVKLTSDAIQRSVDETEATRIY